MRSSLDFRFSSRAASSKLSFLSSIAFKTELLAPSFALRFFFLSHASMLAYFENARTFSFVRLETLKHALLALKHRVEDLSVCIGRSRCVVRRPVRPTGGVVRFVEHGLQSFRGASPTSAQTRSRSRLPCSSLLFHFQTWLTSWYGAARRLNRNRLPTQFVLLRTCFQFRSLYYFTITRLKEEYSYFRNSYILTV